MKSIVKSIRLAAEIFSPALLVTVVMIVYMLRPPDAVKKSNPVQPGIAAKTVYSSLNAETPVNHQLRSQNKQEITPGNSNVVINH